MKLNKYDYCYLALMFLVVTTPIAACPFCHTTRGTAWRLVLLNNNFFYVMAVILIIFGAFVSLVLTLSYWLAPVNTKTHSSFSLLQLKKLLSAGMLLGGSSAGFCDGIIFHQILQTHSMIANKLPLITVVNVEVNMFWDGVFHLLTLATTWLGIVYLWQTLNNKDHHYPAIIFFGSFFLGAGIFNLIEGIIDHNYLQLHHVLQNSRMTVQYYSDIIFIIIALLLIAIGLRIVKSAINALQ